MLTKIAVHHRERHGVVEFHGLPPVSMGAPESSSDEAQRIILEPPGVVRDTVVLAIRARLMQGESRGSAEGIRWERLPEACTECCT